MRVICFHNPDEPCGYLSNWYMSDFKVDDMLFTSMEQYMMYSKAMLFRDSETALKIMKTNDVSVIKRLGREVKNFDEGAWILNREAIITRGLYAKFSQNEVLKKKLLSTGDMLLAECAVHDKIWGIGLCMTDPNRFNPDMWRGLNLLGKCLMEVRQMLKKGY